MLDQASILRFAHLMGEVEADHPLLSLWRTQSPGGRRLTERDRLTHILSQARRQTYSLKKLNRPHEGQIVFHAAAASPSTIGALLPLMQRLRHLGNPPFLLANPATRRFGAGFDLEHQVDVRVWLARASRRAKNESREEARYLVDILRNTFGEEYDEGTSYSLHVAALMKHAAAEYLHGAGALVMETDYFPLSKGLALGARHTGIPVFYVQHGLFGPHQFPMFCNELLCWGDYFREQALLYGMPDTAVGVVGCPRWDELESLRRVPEDSAIRRALGGNPERPSVLLLSNAHGKTSYPGIYRNYFRGVRRLLESGIPVVLKPHPAENGLEYYRGEIPDRLLGKVRVVPQQVSLWEAIRHSDVIYHVFSTAALEAMILNIPVLFAEPGEGQRLTRMPDHGGGRWCPEDDAVQYCTALGKEGEARRELLESQEAFLDHALACRGKATEECVRLIKEGIKVRD